MTAHYHGQIWNGSEIGGSLGVAHTTVRHYLDLLTGAFMIRQLPPWFENVGKRVVKSPKIYLRDSGLLHALLQIPDGTALQGHPKLGASWEGFVIDQIIQQIGERDIYFWAIHSGAELDLLAIRKGQKWGFEIKYADAPVMTKSMKTANQDLDLKHLWVVYPGKQTYKLDAKTTCISLPGLLQVLKGWM
jgi:predicted AAA+ superfamily ATPase